MGVATEATRGVDRPPAGAGTGSPDVTTLLDADRYPASALCEPYFRDIKVSLGLDVLRCKAPEMGTKEVTMHTTAYNTTRAVMQEAASTHQQSIGRMSFKGTTDTVRECAPLFSRKKSRLEKERLSSYPSKYGLPEP